jgi:hypothetical protein
MSATKESGIFTHFTSSFFSATLAAVLMEPTISTGDSGRPLLFSRVLPVGLLHTMYFVGDDTSFRALKGREDE